MKLVSMILYLVTKLQYQAPGYAPERNDRNRDGGGVALYIRNTSNYERIFDLEWTGIKVIKPKAKPFIVSRWYRPLESLGLGVNILGSLNYNVAACPLESHSKNLLEISNLYQYHQLINEHTRITQKSATTIDLFLTNNKELENLLTKELENLLFPKGNQRSWSLDNL